MRKKKEKKRNTATQKEKPTHKLKHRGFVFGKKD